MTCQQATPSRKLNYHVSQSQLLLTPSNYVGWVETESKYCCCTRRKLGLGFYIKHVCISMVYKHRVQSFNGFARDM